MQQFELAKLVMDNLSFTCYIVSLENYDLLYINKPFEDNLTNNFQANIHTRKCYKFLHNRESPCQNCQKACLEKGKKVRKEIYNASTKKYYTQVDTLIELNGKQVKLGMIYDPTIAFDDLESISQKLTLEETLVSCIHTLIEDSDITTSIHSLLSIVAGYYGSTHAYVFELDHKNYTVCKIHEYGLNANGPQIELNLHMPAQFYEPLLNIFSKQGELAFKALDEELAKETEIYKFLKSQQLDGMLVVPFSVDGKLTYFMGVDSPTQKTDDLRLLHSVILFVVDKLRKSKVYDQLVHLSYSDSLTGLWNRNKYNQKMEEFAENKHNTFGYIYVNLNQLKAINELYGEQYGDEILQISSKILAHHLGPDIFRLAGNEFIALFPNVSPDKFNCIIEELRDDLNNHTEFSMAIGAVYQFKNVNIRKGISQSYDIMFAEKQKMYKFGGDSIIQNRQNPVQIILDEITSGYFSMYLQPKVDLQTEEITSAEALIRKFDQNGKMITPDQFIPIYEKEGTVRHVDFFVLEEACKLLQTLIKKEMPLKISVNFSRVTFLTPDLLDEIIETCARYSVPHEYIKVEITESIDKMDFDFFYKKLKIIKDAGFEISLDDFGAKHSNLLMLTMNEFSEVKIDKRLIDYITKSAQNRALVKNILKMISDLGTSICVAEGIETKEQKDLIAEFGCTYGQGYYFYKPMPVEEFLLIYEAHFNKKQLDTSLCKPYATNYSLSYNEMTSILDAMPFCVSILNDKREVISCNNCVLETFGLNKKEEFFSQLFDLSPEFQPNGLKSKTLAFSYLDEAYKTGYLNFPWVHRTKQGKEFSTEVTLKKLVLKNDIDSPLLAAFIREITPDISNSSTIEWTQNYGFNNDVSDRALITTLLEFSSDWLWTFNYKNKQMMFFGEGFEKFGLTREKFIFPDALINKNHVYEEDKAYFIKACQNIAKGEHSPMEMRLNMPDGGHRYFRIIYKIIKNQEGVPLTAIGKVIDIDDQKKLPLYSQLDELRGCYNAYTTKTLINDCIKSYPDSLHALFVLNTQKLINSIEELEYDILKNISNDILAHFREDDIVGTDEQNNFILFLKNPPHIQVVYKKLQLLEYIVVKNHKQIDPNELANQFIAFAVYSKDGFNYDQLAKNVYSKLIL